MRRKRFIFGFAVVLCVGLSFGASQAAAGNASRFVETDVFPQTVCGFSGTTQLVFDLTDVPTGNGYDILAGAIVKTFVADNGRGFTTRYDDGVFMTGPTTYYPDGSSSQTWINDGMNAKTQAIGGPLLEQSTGRVIGTFYFDANGDLVDSVITDTMGPENNTTGSGDCSVIGPYLAGG